MNTITEKIEAIAKVCHETNRAYCATLGDHSQLPWEEAPEWQKTSAINGVKFTLEHPFSSPADSHENWLREKEATGWKYGPVKNTETKEHPCFVPYDKLPLEQQIKDRLFKSVVVSMATQILHEIIEKQPETPTSKVMSEDYDLHVRMVKTLRKVLDQNIQGIKTLPPSRETSLSITNAQQAVMWLGMELKRLGEANPYPSSKDPSTGTVIEPTADGLKF